MYLKFLIPSVLGFLVFLTPISVDGSTTIVLGYLADLLGRRLGGFLHLLVTGLFLVSAIGTVWFSAFKPAEHNKWLDLFVTTWPWVLLRLIGATGAVVTYLNVGPEWVTGADTGQVAFVEIAGIIFCVLLFANFLLPLLTEFGFLEFVGVLLTKPFQRLFKLPGRAGLDALASWVGDSSVGALLTIRQYEQGNYSARQAAVVVTNFSAVSLPFTVVITQIAKLEVNFVTFYLVVLFIGLLAALITPRIPPLSRMQDHYLGGRGEVDEPDMSAGILKTAWHTALAKAATAPGLKEIAQRGTHSCADIYIGVLPAAMAIQFMALVLFTYTEVFYWLSYPLLPLLYLFAIPSPELVLSGTLVGFLDQFVPAIIAADIDDPQVRFILAGLSVSQLIFMAENGALVLRSSIPISLGPLFMVFLWRTIIALPVLSVAARLLH